MMRWYLAAGFMVAIFVVLWGLEIQEVRQRVLPRELSELPNLYLENANVSEFNSAGLSQYTLSSDAISQHTATGRSTLVRPSLTFHQPGESPWHIDADLGVIEGNVSDVGSLPDDKVGSTPSIRFTGQVRLSRRDNDQEFIEFRSESLRIFPELKRVESNEPVMIETSSSNARAAGFECDLEQNYLQLRSSTKQRVHVVIHPQTRI